MAQADAGSWVNAMLVHTDDGPVIRVQWSLSDRIEQESNVKDLYEPMRVPYRDRMGVPPMMSSDNWAAGWWPGGDVMEAETEAKDDGTFVRDITQREDDGDE